MTLPMTPGEKWIKLLGYYAAHEGGSEKALFHERMERCIAELDIPPLEFKHPNEEEILALFHTGEGRWTNVILAGEAGVGKTRLVHKVHLAVGGDPSRLKAKGSYWMHRGTTAEGNAFRAYINRDLSAWRKFGAKKASLEELDPIELWSRLLLGEVPEDGIPSFFIIAANDGQLLKAWKDHSAESTTVAKAYEILESCLQAGTQPSEGVPLRLFHLSSLRTDTVFGLCLDALLEHPGWKDLQAEHSAGNDLFAETSPLRRNYLALRDATIRRRLLDLARLCDANDWHFPIRNILAMLANALLGVSDRRVSPSGVMDTDHIRRLMAEGRPEASNVFTNILGLNLDPAWRERTLGPIQAFRVGLETFNQADNLILFGPEDEDYREDYDKLFLSDPVFPPDPVFEGFRTRYLSSGQIDPNEEDDSSFHRQLITQRRRLFFRLSPPLEKTYNPWRLTNFRYAKEYLEHLLDPVAAGRLPRPRCLGPLVMALNRAWTGLLLDDQDQLFVTTALDLATGKSSEIEVRRIPTRAASSGEFPYVDLEPGQPGARVPRLVIFLREEQNPVTFPLTLTRFEFLQRVANGALPASFSRECSDDIQALKSRILARLPVPSGGSLKLLHVNPDGKAGTVTLNLSWNCHGAL